MGLGKPIGAVAVLLILGAGGYVVANHVIAGQVRAGLDQGIAALPPGVAVKYESLAYSLLDHTTSVSGITLTITQGPMPINETIDRLDVTNGAWNFVNVWAGLKANPAAVSPDMVQPLADDVVVTGLSVSAKNVSASVARTEIKGLRLHPWALLQPSVPPWTSILQLMTENMPAEAPADAKALFASMSGKLALALRFEAAVALAIDCDQVTQEQFTEHVHADANGQVPAIDITASVATIAMPTGFHQAVFGAASMSDFNEDVSGTAGATIAKFQTDPSDFQAAATDLVTGAPLSATLLDKVKFGGFTISGIAAHTPADGTVAVDAINFDAPVFARGYPVAFHFAIDNMHFTAEQLSKTPSSAAAMQMLSLDGLTLSLEMGYRWDLDQQAVTLDRTLIKINELGALAIDGSVGGIAPGVPSAALRNSAVLDQLRLHYIDASLAQRALQATARKQGTDPDTFRRGIVAMIQAQGAVLGNTPAATGIVNALVTFAGAPASLTLTATPKPPLRLDDLAGLKALPPADIVTRLGVTAVANQ